MRNYEITFSVINLLIIPVSFIVLKYGAPAETAFIVYLIMTVFVQIGCLLVIRTLVNLSIRSYVIDLILPIIILTGISFPLMYGMHTLLPDNPISIGAEYLAITILSSILFYYVVLDTAEKNIVNRIILKLINK